MVIISYRHETPISNENIVFAAILAIIIGFSTRYHNPGKTNSISFKQIFFYPSVAYGLALFLILLPAFFGIDLGGSYLLIYAFLVSTISLSVIALILGERELKRVDKNTDQ